MPVIVHQANERKRLGLEYRKSIKEMPFLSLSFGLYWMATVLFLYSPFWLDGTMQSSFARPQAGIITACASIATYFCCASCFRSFAKLNEKPHFLSALSATMALGTVLYLISLAGFLSADFSMFLYIAGLVLLGASTAIACLEFARIFAHIGPQRVLFHGTISLFAGSIGAFVVSLLPEVACAFALIALPAPMSLCLRKTLGALSLPCLLYTSANAGPRARHSTRRAISQDPSPRYRATRLPACNRSLRNGVAPRDLFAS